MNVLRHLFIVILGIGGLAHVAFGQDEQPAFETGTLYLKIYNQAQIELPVFTGKGESGVLDNAGFTELGDIVRKYQTTVLEKPFFLEDDNLQNTYSLTFEAEGSEDAFIAELEGLAYVEYAEKKPIHYLTLNPNDYSPSQLYHLRVINAPLAWDISQGSSDITIAIVDAAVLLNHADLNANIWTNPGEIPNNNIDDDGNGYVDDVNGWDAGDNDNNPNPPGKSHDHGTLVAGCAAAVTNNNIGISSIGFNSKIIAVKAKDNASVGPGLPSAGIVGGIQYAISANADIINMSFGTSNFSNTWQNLMNTAHNKGIILVASAGNDERELANYPASLNHVISVAGTDQFDRISWFTTWHSSVDVSAPGDNIRTTDHSNSLFSTYSSPDGTSFSSPIVAGLAGLMLAVNPCLTPDDVEQYLKSTSVNIDTIPANVNYAGKLGAGRIDAHAALAAVVPTAAPNSGFAVGDTVSCDGTIDFFYDPDSIQACPTQFFWTSNGQTSTDPTATFTYPSSGSYNVSLVVNNAAGTNTINRMVNVVIGSNPSVSAGGDSTTGRLTTCFGQTVTLAGATNVANGTYRWTPTTGLSNPNILNPTFTAITGRTYVLQVTDSLGCAASAQVQVVVGPAISVDAGSNVVIQKGDSALLNASGNVSFYAWSPDTFLSANNIPNPVAKPTQTVTYTVTGSNSVGCIVTDEITVEVEGTNPLSIEAQFAENVGILNSPYPNPATTSLTLSADLKNSGNLQISLYDTKGRLVQTLFDKETWAGEFSLTWNRDPQLPAGIYLAVWKMNDLQMPQKIQLR